MLEVRELPGGHFRVLVAYGTSKKLAQLKPGEFTVTSTDGVAFRLAGLQADTKFCLQDAVELDYDDAWFKPPPNEPYGAAPKLGVLHASLMRKAAAAWDAISR